MSGKPKIIGVFVILMYRPIDKIITLIMSESILKILGSGLPGYKNW